jgi:DNA repair protein SbcD/Mre11
VNRTTTIAAADLPARPDDAVRVLHTSDWHLGVSVRNESRTLDHDAVIDEIVSIAEAAAPDAIVHTGDLFHSGRPGFDDFARALRALRRLAEIAPVVVLAGNHDSAVAIETLRVALDDPVAALDGPYDPLAPLEGRIRVLHKPMTATDGAVMTFPTRAGGRLRVVGLPFLHANKVLSGFDGIDGLRDEYTDRLRKVYSNLTKRATGTDFDSSADVAVLASHLHIDGARTSTEKEIHISESYATDVAHIPGVYGYIAFGHIHIAQHIDGSRGRYAGSILQVDFGEEGETKQVVVADLTPARATRIHDVALTAGRRIHRREGTIDELAGFADEIGDGIVEVTVRLPEPDPDDGTAEIDHDPAAETDADGGDKADGDHGDDGAGGFGLTAGLGGHDSLAEAVRAALPYATVVSIVDARYPHVATADEIDLDEAPESPAEAYRNWFATKGARAISNKRAAAADPQRIVTLFEELYTAVTTDNDPTLPELDRIRALTAVPAETSGNDALDSPADAGDGDDATIDAAPAAATSGRDA